MQLIKLQSSKPFEIYGAADSTAEFQTIWKGAADSTADFTAN